MPSASAVVSKNKNRKQKVRFSERVQCRKTLSRRGYTTSEIRQTWISPDEMAEMAERQRTTLGQFSEGAAGQSQLLSDTSNSTTTTSTYHRGLESLSVQGSKQLADAVASCLYAVLSEQEKQRRWNNNNTDRLARASQRVSIISKCLAYERAQADGREAQKVYQVQTTTSTTTSVENVKSKFSNEKQSCLLLQQKHPSLYATKSQFAVLRQ
eukprot:scaffold1307_cov108-Cylindrotheca_fusiformis.AAC.3